MDLNHYCPCGKDKLFSQCCGRFLNDKLHAKTPEQLMRSRYSAYALGGYGTYLINTWHPSMVSSLTADDLSAKKYHWTKLEVLSKSQKGDEATVEFNAYFTNDENEPCKLHENSYFQRIAGRWLYVGADIK